MKAGGNLLFRQVGCWIGAWIVRYNVNYLLAIECHSFAGSVEAMGIDWIRALGLSHLYSGFWRAVRGTSSCHRAS